MYNCKMRDEFELLDPANAEAFLQRFPAAVRRMGEALFRSGRVQEVFAEEPGISYSMTVKDGKLEEVQMDYDEAVGWAGSCTCPREVLCAHVFAGMKAVLSETMPLPTPTSVEVMVPGAISFAVIVYRATWRLVMVPLGTPTLPGIRVGGG